MYIVSAGIEGCLCRQNRVIKKFYAKPKIFGFKFYAGVRVKCNKSITISIVITRLYKTVKMLNFVVNYIKLW